MELQAESSGVHQFVTVAPVTWRLRQEDYKFRARFRPCLKIERAGGVARCRSLGALVQVLQKKTKTKVLSKQFGSRARTLLKCLADFL